MSAFSNRPGKFNKTRGIAGIGMGFFYFFIAYWVVYMEKLEKINIGETFSYLVAGLMVFYGIFRIYRGWKIYNTKA